MKQMTIVLLIAAFCAVPAWSARKVAAPGAPPLPILSPTALTADAGDGRAYLSWNPQIEDARVVGWQVQQLAPQPATLTPDTLTDTAYVARGLVNGTAYTFAVVGVLHDGQLTPASNTVTVTPRDVGVVKLAPVREKLSVGEFTELALSENAVRAVFPDGQELVFDSCRPVDWKTRDGQHLLYPKAFGNGVDIGKFDNRGLPMIIPPDGMKNNPIPEKDEGHAPKDIVDPEYRDLQFGCKHPYLTDPMTLSQEKSVNDAHARWLDPVVDGNRVTFHYLLPLSALGFRSWTNVEVWETWWPLERDRHGCGYHGLARQVEVSMPDPLKYGYQVMLNNGFGPGGSRKGVVSYSTGFREPASEIVDYSATENRQVFFQSFRPVRAGYGYHPDGNCLQASPLIFYDWGAGSLTITARSLYYHCSNNSSSYIEQGADGVWPNLAWDMAAVGRRTPVDTVEYLYTAAMTQPLPQRFINARFETYGDVSRRMGVQDTLGAVALNATMGEVKPSGGPEAYAEKMSKTCLEHGVDVLAIYHDTWQANPDVVAPAYRFDEKYDCNPSIKAMNAKFQAAGVHPGFWFRPEFCKTSIVTAFSSNVEPYENYYHSVEWMHYPEGATAIPSHSLPTIRDHPEWIRRQRDGAWPANTPYQWIPMSLASGWWDQVMWPALSMSSRLGFERMLMDGGFGGMQGVDYAPMLAGNSPVAVPCQPYWWRVFRSMHAVGIKLFGECTVGWKGGNTVVGRPGDENFLWMFQMGWIVDGRIMHDPEQVHRAFQLYNSSRNDTGNDQVRRFAQRFYREHPAPDWIEFTHLRQGDPVTVTLTGSYSPVAGMSKPADAANPYSFTVRPWLWDEVIWHYQDGTQAVYPSYAQVDWSRQ